MFHTLPARHKEDRMVRIAEEKELPRVNELRAQVNTLHAAGRPDIFRPGFGAELQAYVHILWESEDSDVLVVLRDGVICGFACVEYVRKPETAYGLARAYYHVAEFGVDLPYRRQGVATELVAYMKQDAAARGFSRIELDVWALTRMHWRFTRRRGLKLTAGIWNCSFSPCRQGNAAGIAADARKKHAAAIKSSEKVSFFEK